MNDILIESYQNLLEFQQEQFTTLSFELAKNEHEAIVSENMMLYKEAEEDFKTKLVNIAKTLYNKFMDFLTRAISTIMNLYVKISKKFLNKETMKKLENTVKEIKSIYRSEPNAKIAIDAIFKKSKITIHSLNGILNINDLKHLIKKLAVTLNKENLADSMDEIKKILDDLKKFGETDKGELIDSENAFNGSMVIKSYVVIDNMKNWIGVLKELRGTGTKQYKADLKNIQDGKISSEDRLNIAIIQRACSRTISSINYIAMSAIKILRSIDYISSKFNRVKSNNDDEIYNEPDEPNVDKSDRRKWKKGKTRIFRNNDYVNLANDEKEWLEYNRRTREHLKKENKKKEANDLKEKAHRLGYTHEDVDILDMFGEDNLFLMKAF